MFFTMQFYNITSKFNSKSRICFELNSDSKNRIESRDSKRFPPLVLKNGSGAISGLS